MSSRPVTAPDVIARLAVLPQRQFHLLCAAIMLAAAAALWSGCLRTPWTQLRASQAEHEKLARLPNDTRLLQQQYDVLARRVAVLEAGLGLSSRANLDQRQLELISEINRIARLHGVQVLGAAPVPTRVVASFNELPFEITATGSYQQASDWLEELEQALPNVALVQLEMAGNPAASARDIKLNIAAYFPQEAIP